ncbi:MAG: FAD-binding oxidoreductase [Proteobacteria bacterium]|nr:FAD-binding oxidoreductase [Pseudomonadota bacterium]
MASPFPNLPDNISAEVFASACSELRAIVGDQWVIRDNVEHLGSYRDSFSPSDINLNAPSAAVAPQDVTQVQKILAVARRYRIPLWTVSTGRNYGYGGAAPRKAGCVVLDLKRMNRIIEVNEKHAYAVVEPGVSFQELYQYLQQRNIKLWPDPSAPAWGGIVGNTADRGVGYTPYGEHFTVQCGMQVVLADGSVVETGMAASGNASAKNLYKYGHGPWVDGLFTQSNFGVITQMGVWLLPEPPGYRPYMVTFPREDDIHQIIELVRPLKINMLIPNAATTVGLIWEAAVKVTKAHYYSGDGVMPDSARNKMAADLDIGQWNFYGALYGPEPIMDNNWKIIRERLAEVPGAKFYFAEDRQNDAAFDYRAKLMRGIPNMTEFGLLNWLGPGSHIDFSPISPVTGSGALQQFEFMRDKCHEFGFDYIGEFLIGWRDMHHVLMLVFNRDNEAQKTAVKELFDVLVAQATAKGYGEYRTHLEYMDKIAASYNWNDGALAKVNQSIKNALDPDGILSPGKSGIWPNKLGTS